MRRASLLICLSLPGSEPQEALSSLTLASDDPGFLVVSEQYPREPVSCIICPLQPDLACLLCLQILMFLTPSAY